MDISPKTEFMKRAIGLAKRGGGWVNPNPQVGCVIVRESSDPHFFEKGCGENGNRPFHSQDRDAEIIGEGYHHAFGKPHAEREALTDCFDRGNDPKGATAYVTLEPCAHYGKTPPCVEALIEAQVGCVVIGSSDPNPLVAGKGVARLREAGIDVVEGFMARECDAMNEPFFHYINTGLPLVIAKYAMTLDGKFATVTGKSRWITGAAARERVHEDRARYAAVMVGVGTVVADDPMLNVRLDVGPLIDAAGICDESFAKDVDPSEGPHQPARIIIDSHLRTPIDSRLVQTADVQRTIIVTTEDSPETHRPYLERNCEILVVGEAGQSEVPFLKDSADETSIRICGTKSEERHSGRVDLKEAVEALGKEGIDSVILEGGRTLMDAAFGAGIVDKVQAYIAPKVFAAVDEPSDAVRVEISDIQDIGNDLLIEGDCI